MKLSTLRKIYPYLSNNIKNRKWRSLTDTELNMLQQEKQVISNCYDMSVRHALLATESGRAALKSRIKIQKGVNNPAFRVKFNINGKDKTYTVENNENLSLGKLLTKTVSKMIQRNPSQKPLISRFGKFGANKPCEFNRPSNAIKWYTGKEALSYGEGGINLSLKPYKEKVLDLLTSLGKDNPENYSFVVLSGFKPDKCNGGKKMHCLTVAGVDNAKQTLDIINKRTNDVITVGFDEFINKFKGIIGIKG